MQIFYFMGVPGSGKSFTAKALSKKIGIPHLSADLIKEEIFGDAVNVSKEKNKQAFLEMRKRADFLVSEGKSFIWDATGVSQFFREEELSGWKCDGVEIIGIMMAVSKEVAKERNSQRDRNVPNEVIDRMQQAFIENPVNTEKNPFDEIWAVDENNRIEKIFNRETEMAPKKLVQNLNFCVNFL